MRTTVTLDPDALALLRRRMAERGSSFKQAINDAIRDGAGGPKERSPFRTATADMGMPAVTLDRALHLAAELEDEERVRAMQSGG